MIKKEAGVAENKNLSIFTVVNDHFVSFRRPLPTNKYLKKLYLSFIQLSCDSKKYSILIRLLPFFSILNLGYMVRVQISAEV